MITPKQAGDAVKQKYPKFTIGPVFDYDQTHFVVEATEKTNETDFNAPYYAVDKSSGKVSCFAPGDDFDKWFDCLDRGPVSTK